MFLFVPNRIQGRGRLSRGLRLGLLLCLGESWYVLVCVEWIGVSACRSAHLTCLGGYFLCMLATACIGSFCTAGTGTCIGIAVCLVSVKVVSSYAGSCFLYFTKVMALFSNSPPNDNSVKTARQCYKYLLH